MTGKLEQTAISLIALFIVFTLHINAQTTPANSKKRECGTVVTERQKLVESEREATNFYKPLAPQANRPYWIPMTIHIVRRANGSDGFTLDQLSLAFYHLNRLWLRAGVQFYQYGNIDYINNDFYYNLPDSDIARNSLRQVNPVAHTINVYFTNLAGICGEASFTTSEYQGILVSNDCAGTADNPSTFAHEVGHYFDLYHTHETRFGRECPNGSNCSTAGDKICDTPADPDLTGAVNESCAWTGSAMPPESCGSTPYTPSMLNIMSYSGKTCRIQFTDNQESKALSVLTTAANRVNLINTISKYVAPSGILSVPCSYQNPCSTLQQAVETADHGDHIFLLGGTYQFTPINRLVFLKKWNTDSGDVFIVP